jgi:hypothetical protein
MDKKIQERQQVIISLIEGFCKNKLDDEYFELSKKIIQKLGRKRNVPFATGQAEIWAAATIHALGTINFLFDKSFKPYVTIEEINDFFGTSKSTTGNKSKQIRNLLKLEHYDREFSTIKMLENNPFNDFVMVDGYIVSVKSLPEEQQQIVRQARAEGKDVMFTSKE